MLIQEEGNKSYHPKRVKVLTVERTRTDELTFPANCYISNYLEGIRIMWGSESASFSEENSTLIPIEYYDNGNEKLMYSFAFIDIDYDGFFEMVTTGTNIPVDSSYGPNSGGFIEIYKNNGDRSFNNITDSRIQNNQWNSEKEKYKSVFDIS